VRVAKKRFARLSKASTDARRAKAKTARLRTEAIAALRAARKELVACKRSCKALAERYKKALEAAEAAIARYEPHAPVMMPTIDDDALTLHGDFDSAIEAQIEIVEGYTADVEARE
jgi:hypothetical protein